MLQAWEADTPYNRRSCAYLNLLYITGVFKTAFIANTSDRFLKFYV